MLSTRFTILIIVFFALTACGETKDTPEETPSIGTSTLGAFETCPLSTRVGGIELTLRDQYTSVQGTITDGVRPSDVPLVDQSYGKCELLRPKTLFCDPSCGSGKTCNDDGTCVPLPTNQSVGLITISGMSTAVEMEARAPIYYYNFIGDLPHPGFIEGQELQLWAAGDDAEAFGIATVGIAALSVTSTTMPLEQDLPGVLEWVAATSNDATKIEIELNIANHGGTPARVTCTTDDSGHFEIPVSLINALLGLGFSGFPSVALTRVGANATTTSLGCVDFRAQSMVVLEVEIPGLISCSNNDDCPIGQSCQQDLTCG